ncbi:MAG: hypothetical protein PUC37_05180 [Spirochaetales bacterium]|nr:hypothetical protein [Spirochaetales bacterium]
MNNKNQKGKKIFFIIAISLALLSLIIFIPQFRQLIIFIFEKIRNREINRVVWNKRFIKLELAFLIIDLLSILILKFKLYPIFSSVKKTKGLLKAAEEIQNPHSIKNPFFTRKSLICIFVCYIALTGLRLFYINQKKSFHIDEPLSISICNRNEYGFWGKIFESNKEFSAKEIKEMAFFDNATIKDSLSDIYHLHLNNEDSPHTNFYYSFLRLWFTGKKTGNIDYIFIRACLLNVLFFTISFIFLILLIKEFPGISDFKLFCCLIIAFANPAAVSLTLFIRPYELQQTMVIILCWYVVHILNKYKDKKIITTFGNFIAGSIVLSLTLLSGYFNFILVGLLGLCLIIMAINKKDFNLLYYFIYMFIAALILDKILYFSFGKGLLEDRGTEALGKLGGSQFMNNLSLTLGGLKNIIIKNNIFILCFIILSFIFFLISSFKNLKSENYKFSKYVVLICAIVSIFISLWFAPYKEARYIAPYFSVLILAYISTLKLEKIYMPIISLFLIITYIPNKSQTLIEHLDDSNISQFDSLYSSDYISKIKNSNQTFIIQNAINWRLGSILPYLKNNSKIIFTDNASDILETIKNKPVIYMYQNSNEKNSVHIEDLDIEFIQMDSISDYSIYYVPQIK